MLKNIKWLAALLCVSCLSAAVADPHCVRSVHSGHININCTGHLTPQQAARITHGILKADGRIAHGLIRMNHNIMKQAFHHCWRGIAGRWHCP